MGKAIERRTAMQICQICKQKPATIHLTDINNNVKKEIHMCETCASAKGFSFAAAAKLPQLLGLSAQKKAATARKARPPEEPELVCSVCGRSWSEFRAKGRLGCPHDYEAFRERLDPILVDMHGGDARHVGKRPRGDNRRRDLWRERREAEERLREAVRGEKYEEAANLRDRLRHLKVELEQT